MQTYKKDPERNKAEIGEEEYRRQQTEYMSE
jgi:hypothetical protein